MDKLKRVLPTLRSSTFLISMALGSCASMYAQSGNVSFQEFLNFAGGLLAFFLIVGAVAVVLGLIMCIGNFLGGQMGRAAMGVVAVVAGGIIIGYSKTWAQAFTGQTLP